MLNVESLCCRRAGRVVFRDVSFTAKPGDCILVTGANGSGKSSLLRILAGLCHAHSGVFLRTPSRPSDKIDFASSPPHYIGHLDALKSELTVLEMLAYWRALRGAGILPADEPLAAFGLSDFAHRAIRTLSAGQRRRLSLTRLVMSPSALWLLDEPTTCLDTSSQQMLFDQFARHRRQGGIVIVATHEIISIEGASTLSLSGTR